MMFLNTDRSKDMPPPEKGKILIADPFLNDDSGFTKSVVAICEHGSEGTLGFVLNKPTQINLADLVPALEPYIRHFTIYKGGPVQTDTLHILHNIPDILGGLAVSEGVYWGGSYENLQDGIKDGTITAENVKLFLGYSGWSSGQLLAEMKDNSWLIGNLVPELVFNTDDLDAWRMAIKNLGPEYAIYANMPSNPQLN